MVVGAAVLTAARFIVTGIILLGAVTLDTLSRRRLAESGR
jgi:ABC-type xylose transport system permease subunit